MAKVNYYLSNKPDTNGNRLILLYYSFNAKRIISSTNESINPKNWNPKSKRAKSSMSGSLELNAKLDSYAEQVQSMYRRLQLGDKIINDEILKSNISDIVSNKEKQSELPDIFIFVETFISNVQNTRANATILAYNTTVTHLKLFQKEHLRGKRLDFQDIDLNFYNSFLNYLTEHNLSKNSIGKHIKTLKVFLNEATERGVNTNLNFRSKKFKVLKEDSDSVYLNEEEITRLYNLDLSKTERLDKTRDLFIIGCWTGLRFGDLSQVNRDNIKDDFLTVRTKKTDQKIVIPLHHLVKSTLEKYNYSLPRLISNQKLNDYLKEICEMAEINEDTVKSMTKGGKTSSTKNKKFDLITSHTARRSFATNQYLRGVPSRLIMMITGHKTETVFLKYIKVTAQEEAERLKEMWRI